DPAGIIRTFAGNCAAQGLSGDGGPATSALFHTINDISFGPDASLYVAESDNHRIRHIDGNGVVATVAGSTQGFSGDGGPATQARLDRPWGVDVTSDGPLYIADLNNVRIRRVSPEGVITTVAGGGSGGTGGLAVNASVSSPL